MLICDVKFVISYLVKHVTEKESRAHLNFNTRDKESETKIDNINTDQFNEKIMGVEIRNKEKKLLINQQQQRHESLSYRSVPQHSKVQLSSLQY